MHYIKHLISETSSCVGRPAVFAASLHVVAVYFISGTDCIECKLITHAHTHTHTHTHTRTHTCADTHATCTCSHIYNLKWHTLQTTAPDVRYFSNQRGWPFHSKETLRSPQGDTTWSRPHPTLDHQPRPLLLNSQTAVIYNRSTYGLARFSRAKCPSWWSPRDPSHNTHPHLLRLFLLIHNTTMGIKP